MSILYIANATRQHFEALYRSESDSAYPFIPPAMPHPQGIQVPAGQVVQTADMDAGTITKIIGQLSPYIGEWSGSGVGYSVDAPISLS